MITHVLKIHGRKKERNIFFFGMADVWLAAFVIVYYIDPLDIAFRNEPLTDNVNSLKRPAR